LSSSATTVKNDQPSFWAEHAASVVVAVIGSVVAGAIPLWLFGWYCRESRITP
jgi:hypothetical protein